jgi:hypothetical protein
MFSLVRNTVLLALAAQAVVAQQIWDTVRISIHDSSFDTPGLKKPLVYYYLGSQAVVRVQELEDAHQLREEQFVCSGIYHNFSATLSDGGMDYMI